jgi:hypothetical protein
VILIGALLLSFMVPNISALKGRALREHANGIIAMVDLGRQRAVVTRTPHRLHINIKGATYGLEWLAPVDEVDPQAGRDAAGFEIDAPLSLAPPLLESREFLRLPGLMGRLEALGNGVRFAKIETGGSSVTTGDVYVDFYRDGTSSATVINLDDPDGRSIQLEIRPLADAVRIHNEEV